MEAEDFRLGVVGTLLSTSTKGSALKFLNVTSDLGIAVCWQVWTSTLEYEYAGSGTSTSATNVKEEQLNRWYKNMSANELFNVDSQWKMRGLWWTFYLLLKSSLRRYIAGLSHPFIYKSMILSLFNKFLNLWRQIHWVGGWEMLNSRRYGCKSKYSNAKSGSGSVPHSFHSLYEISCARFPPIYSSTTSVLKLLGFCRCDHYLVRLTSEEQGVWGKRGFSAWFSIVFYWFYTLVFYLSYQFTIQPTNLNTLSYFMIDGREDTIQGDRNAASGKLNIIAYCK